MTRTAYTRGITKGMVHKLTGQRDVVSGGRGLRTR